MIDRSGICSVEDWKKSLGALADKAPSDFGVDQCYTVVVEMLNKYAGEDKPDKNIRITLTAFGNWGGSQWIADGEVADLGKPRQETYNWHLQNTSQWLFACGVVFDERSNSFSIHT